MATPTPWADEDERFLTHHKCDVCETWVPLNKWRPDMSAHYASYGAGVWSSCMYSCPVEPQQRTRLGRFGLWLLGETPLDRGRRMLGLPPKPKHKVRAGTHGAGPR